MAIKIIIIGGGIVGLAAAHDLINQLPDASITLVEKEPAVAGHQTGHNSGVIHSGLYYKPGSFKAKLCVQGAREMAAFCAAQKLPYKITGKVVVATTEGEIPRLEELHRRGVANGIPGMERIGPERLREIEPHAAGVAALWVPGTGIVDYRAVSQRLGEMISAQGAALKLGVQALGAVRGDRGWTVHTTEGDLQADFLVNCGGLHSDRVAAFCGTRPDVRIVPFRGEYYKLRPEAESLVKGLIYPVPDPTFPFLGVHFTRFVHGGVEAGPNAVLALKREGYKKSDVSLRDAADTFLYPGFWKLARRHMDTGWEEIVRSFSRRAFARSLQRLVPAVQETDLLPGGSGVRAQALAPDGALVDDFRFLEGPGALHVLNAPSPAATASLPIGRLIGEKVRERLGKK